MKESSKLILVIEDSTDAAALIRQAFHRSGFNNPIHTAHSRAQALAYLKGEHEYADRQKFPFPDLIILDHDRPDDAWPVVEWVRQRPDLDSLPIVVFSGSDDPRNQKRAFEMGVNAYHLKPTLSDEFSATIKRIAGFWLLRKSVQPRGDG